MDLYVISLFAFPLEFFDSRNFFRESKNFNGVAILVFGTEQKNQSTQRTKHLFFFFLLEFLVWILFCLGEQNRRILVLLFAATGGKVGLAVKVKEESQKGNGIKEVDEGKLDNIHAPRNEDFPRSLDDEEHELTDLELGDERLPGAGDVVGSKEVVGVHKDMDEGVVHGGEVSITLGEIIQVQPPNEEDGEVMVKMKNSDLLGLLPQSHDDGVKEFVDFGNVEDPDQSGHGAVSIRGDGAVAKEGVSVLDGLIGNTNSHVPAQDDKEGIVEDPEVEEVVGFSLFHELHQQIDDNQVENRDDKSITNISEGPITGDLTGRVLVTPKRPHGVGLVGPVEKEGLHC